MHSRVWLRGCQLVAVLAACAGPALTQTKLPLAETSWHLVRFQGGDGTVVTPDDGSKYTVTFNADGTLAARIDCNRGRGTWKSSGPSQLVLGPLALTRAMCAGESMHDRIAKQWTSIRSYVIKDRHLFLSLMADGGIYEFQPALPVSVKGPVTFTCGSGEALRATFYGTQPAMALLQRGNVTRPAFQVKAASGSKYEGEDVLFWEARGEATLNWMGDHSTCKPN